MTGPSLAANPRLSQWLAVSRDGHVLVRTGKVELGQGILTALTQVVSEELDVDPRRVRLVETVTGSSPDESYTSGSLSVQHSGEALRLACAQVRLLYLSTIASDWSVPIDDLAVADGTVTAPDGRTTSWWDVASSVDLDLDVAVTTPKDPAAYHSVGTSLPRVDIPDKVAGRARFVQDLQPAAMLHGRVLRPPSRGASLVSVDDEAVHDLPGVVAVVRDGSFLGIVAEREEVALRGIDLLRDGCVWDEQDTLPAQSALTSFLLEAPVDSTILLDTRRSARTASARSVHFRFTRPYLAHGSIGTSTALALWQDGGVAVWTHSQGVYKLRAEISRSLSLAADRITVHHAEGAGCYGHNGADDAAYDAVLLARATPGRPVRVAWSRQDELSWSPLAPAMVVDVRADVDDAGRVQRWEHEVWSNGHSGRPGAPDPGSPFLAATHVEAARQPIAAGDPPLKNGGGSGRNAAPLYTFPQQLVTTHRLTTMPLRTSAMRALGAHLNVYAIESVVDELALLAGVDPVQYRLGMLDDSRARDVLLAAVERAGPVGTVSEGRGRGVGIAQYKGKGAYCAVVADVHAESSVRVVRLVIAVDVGLVVNPDGVVNQIEGGALQSVSWTTKEQVRFDGRNVTSADWESYPILTFSEAPAVDVVLLDRPQHPSVGAGEASIGPTAAAIGNAMRAATGLRVRALPLTPDNVVASMDELDGGTGL